MPVHREWRERVELAETVLCKGGEIEPQLRLLLAPGQRLAPNGTGHQLDNRLPRALGNSSPPRKRGPRATAHNQRDLDSRLRANDEMSGTGFIGRFQRDLSSLPGGHLVADRTLEPRLELRQDLFVAGADGRGGLGGS